MKKFVTVFVVLCFAVCTAFADTGKVEKLQSEIQQLNKQISELKKTVEFQRAEIKRLKTLCQRNGIDLSPKKWIEGEWFIVATNPVFAGKIITDYISFEFSSDGSVTKTIRSDGNVKTEKGTYKCNLGKTELDAKFDLGEAGVQVLTWRQNSEGKATIVFWKNLTYGHERSEDELYIKKGTAEWDRRGKKTLNPQTTHPFVDPYQLVIGTKYCLSRKTPLMPSLNPADPIAAIQQMKQIPKGGVFKVLETVKKRNSPWYKVIAFNQRKQRIGTGWINSTALLGQELKACK